MSVEILSKLLAAAWQTDRKEHGPFAISPDKEYGRNYPRDSAIRKVNKDFGETRGEIVFFSITTVFCII